MAGVPGAPPVFDIVRVCEALAPTFVTGNVTLLVDNAKAASSGLSPTTATRNWKEVAARASMLPKATAHRASATVSLILVRIELIELSGTEIENRGKCFSMCSKRTGPAA
jgi:hypothetical protein